MIIKEQDLVKKYVPTEQEIKSAEGLINDWAAVAETVKSPGWQILIAEIHEKLATYDSVSKTTIENFPYNKGLVNGLQQLLEAPKQLEQKATSAAEFLKNAGLAETEE